MKVTAIAGGLVSLILAFALVVWLGGGASESGSNSTVAETKDPEKEIYTTNPFQEIASGPAPKLEVDSAEHDFGAMKMGGSGTHDFVVRNTGTAPLKMVKGPSTCQCTFSELSQVEVPPGESTTITLSWEPNSVNETFQQQAKIWTNDPALREKGDLSPSGEGELILTVKGEVFNSVEMEPSDFSLGTLDETQPTTVEAHIYSKILEDLKVSLKKSSSEFITVEILPADPEKLKELQAKSGWKVRATIEPRLSIGRVRESITLDTSDDVTPEATIHIQGFRNGPVTIGGRYWNQAYTMVDFPTFDAEKGIETTLNIYTPRSGDPLKLELATKEPEWLEVEVESKGLEEPVAGASEDSLREWHTVRIAIPAGRPPERLIGPDAGRLVFATSLEEVPEIKIRVVAESR